MPEAGPQNVEAISEGSFYILKRDVLMQGAVSKQHIHELAGLMSRCCRGKRDTNQERAVAAIFDLLDAPCDLIQHEAILDRVERHLHALLDRKRIGFPRDLFAAAADTVKSLETHEDRTSYFGRFIPALKSCPARFVPRLSRFGKSRHVSFRQWRA